MQTLKLYNYFRSSTSFRVRIALNLKQLDYEYIPVHLLQKGGEQNQPAYRKINPMGGVPTLIHDEVTIAQSSAIIEYLDDVFPQTHPLFPPDPVRRAHVRQFCQIINADSHAYGNLKTLNYLDQHLKISAEQKNEWVQQWMNQGLTACEKFIAVHGGKCVLGDAVTAAETFLIPFVVTAERFHVATKNYELVSAVFEHCMRDSNFQKAHPFRQPDTPDEFKSAPLLLSYSR